MNESNRRIASLNRIDELNQRIAFQNDPKRPVESLMGRQDRSKRAQEPPRAAQDPLKTAQKPPKTLQRGPKSPQERPKIPPRRPKIPPGALLGRSWTHLGTIKAQDRKPDRPGSIGGKISGDLNYSPVEDWLPDFSQESASWAPLGALLEAKSGQVGSEMRLDE